MALTEQQKQVAWESFVGGTSTYNARSVYAAVEAVLQQRASAEGQEPFWELLDGKLASPECSRRDAERYKRGLIAELAEKEGGK